MSHVQCAKLKLKSLIQTKHLTKLDTVSTVFQELQTKLAAQKLAEGVTIGMRSYSTDESVQAAYRVVHDDSELSD